MFVVNVSLSIVYVDILFTIDHFCNKISIILVDIFNIDCFCNKTSIILVENLLKIDHFRRDLLNITVSIDYLIYKKKSITICNI